jgi:hypothetical protein
MCVCLVFIPCDLLTSNGIQYGLKTEVIISTDKSVMSLPNTEVLKSPNKSLGI